MKFSIALLLGLLLLTSPTLAQTLLGEVHTSTTGAGSGTTLQGYLVEGPKASLYLAWSGRGGDKRAGITLNAAQVAELKAAMVKAIKSGQPGDYATLTSEGNTLVVQNQADERMKVTYLILKPLGAKGRGEWVMAQVNLEAKEEAAVRQLFDKMMKALKG